MEDLRDKQTREKAKVLYLAGLEPDEILAKLNVDKDSLHRLIYDGGEKQRDWYHLRKAMPKASIAMYLKNKVNVLERTSGIAVDILNKSLIDIQKKIDEGELTLTMHDLRQLTSIITDMDKIVRLEAGKATEIVDSIGLTTMEARAILARDPFLDDDIIEADIVEEKKDETVYLD